MINISVLSSDLLFACMLKSEIETLGREYSVKINEYDSEPTVPEMIILDLDSVYANSSLPECDIIGFFKNDMVLRSDITSRCKTVLHRPFSNERLKNIVEALSAGKDSYVAEASDKIINISIPPSDVRLRIDEEECSAYFDGRKIHLSNNEYAILNKLLMHTSEPVSREELNSVLSSSGGNMCDVYVCHLRTKLESGRSERFIFTVRGKGYMLKI